jgi:hypothetical protein
LPLGFFVYPSKRCWGFYLKLILQVLVKGDKMKDINELEKNQRVVTFLNRDEVDFLDKLGKDALFSTGLKLSRAKLIAWLVEFMKELNISGKDIRSEQDFENKIKEVLDQSLRGSVPPAIKAK